jgi:hypothetical protein
VGKGTTARTRKAHKRARTREAAFKGRRHTHPAHRTTGGGRESAPGPGGGKGAPGRAPNGNRPPGATAARPTYATARPSGGVGGGKGANARPTQRPPAPP